MSDKEPLRRSSSSRVFIGGFNDMFTQWLPGHEKVMKQAFYNAVAVVFIALAIVASIAVYLVLQPFLRPLLWAVLFGSALHPFKQQLTRVTKQWLAEVQDTNTPLVIGAIILPFNIINWSLNGLISIVKQYAKLSLQFIDYLQNLCNFWVVASLAITHLLTVTFWWTNETRVITEKLSPVVWIALSIKVVQSLGTLGIVATTIVVILVLTGIIRSLFVSQSGSSTSGDEIDSVRRISSQLLSVIRFIWNSLKSLLPSHPNQEQYLLETPSEDRSSIDATDVGDNVVSSSTGTVPVFSQNLQSGEDEMNLSTYSHGPFQNSQNKNNFSNGCLYALLWSCLLAQIWLRPQVIYLLSIPLALIIFKWLFQQLNNSEFLIARLHTFKLFFDARKEAIFNSAIRTVYQYLVIGDRMVYHESTHLMLLTGNLVNSTVVNNPELSQLFPGNFIEKTMIDEMMANAYIYGRNWIKNNIYIIGDNGVNVNASVAVEKQILEVWDRVYHMWLNRSENLTKGEFEQKFMRSNSFEAYNWDKLFGALKSLNFVLLFNLLKENIDIIVSVFDSIWSILKGNITLLFTTFTAIISLLLHGSSAILNMFLSL
ncbi:transmembrane protein 245-like protein, partial [Leptotrombidium deliense]